MNTLTIPRLRFSLTNIIDNVEGFLFRNRYRELTDKVERLELIEWKATNRTWQRDLRNISTAHDVIDTVFDICRKATIRDFGINDETLICSKSAAQVCMFVSAENDTTDDNRRLKNCEYLSVHHAYVRYNSNPWNQSNQLDGQFVFGGVKCLLQVPASQTNIIGYIEYKHAYLNHEPWLDDVIKKLVFNNPYLRIEEYVRLFRDKYHRIPNDDRNLYRTILKYKLN